MRPSVEAAEAGEAVVSDVNELRARCPSCRKNIEVRRKGKAWRMIAHGRYVSSYGGSRFVPCPVRDVNALPCIERWLALEEEDYGRAEKEHAKVREDCAEMLAKADASDAAITSKRARNAALLVLIGGGE